MNRDREMDNADRLFDAMNSLCDDQPNCDVIYALAMMYAKALKDSEVDIKTAARAFGEVVAMEMKFPRSRVNLTITSPPRDTRPDWKQDKDETSLLPRGAGK